MKIENDNNRNDGYLVFDGTNSFITGNPNNQKNQAKNADDDEDEKDTSDEESDADQEKIIKTGSVTSANGEHKIYCLTIIGQIEGHYTLASSNKTTKYEHIIPQLVAIEQDENIEGLLIILNTVGGDVEAGLAIAELISGMKKPTVSLVLGGGHSIGVPLAVSAKSSFIAKSATMTVHPVRMNGLVLGVPQAFSYFERMQERITNFVERNSNISKDRFTELMMNTGELVMDVGTVLDGDKAVAEGLIDKTGGLSDAISCLYDIIKQYKKDNDKEKDNENDESSQSKEEDTSKNKSSKSKKEDNTN